jgi:endonuclease YncB( thermonuclease family)
VVRVLKVLAVALLPGLAFLAGGALAPAPAPAQVPGAVTPAQPIVFPPKEGVMLVLPLEVLDGDSVRFAYLVSDVGRLAGIQAPELHGAEAAAGEAAKKQLGALLFKEPTTIRIIGREKFGRALVEFYTRDGRSVNNLMVETGHATKWDGRGQRPSGVP